ncbi:MAG: hypothetical protein FWG72_09270 [Oscillospiraceae bacterium]|nr:hypothetical protein [Oscillospiraceae bacterium]
MTRHLFVVNPLARNAGVLAEEGRGICERLGLDAAVKVSGYAGETIKIVREEALTGADLRVYVFGGDGSLNEAVCGCAGFENVALTQIPCGTGNDFVRCFGGKEIFLDMEKMITSSREVMLDLMDVAIDGAEPRRAVNICSVGMDADVAAGMTRYKWARRFGSKMPYNLSLAAALFRGIKRPYTVTFGDERLEEMFTIITCCNGQVYGGGFKACPDADPADGRLEFLLVKGIGRLTLLRVVGRYANGKYKELTKYIRHNPGSSISVESKKPFYANCDGEVFPAGKAVFSLSPHKLRFILP